MTWIKSKLFIIYAAEST